MNPTERYHAIVASHTQSCKQEYLTSRVKLSALFLASTASLIASVSFPMARPIVATTAVGAAFISLTGLVAELFDYLGNTKEILDARAAKYVKLIKGSNPAYLTNIIATLTEIQSFGAKNAIVEKKIVTQTLEAAYEYGNACLRLENFNTGKSSYVVCADPYPPIDTSDEKPLDLEANVAGTKARFEAAFDTLKANLPTI